MQNKPNIFKEFLSETNLKRLLLVCLFAPFAFFTLQQMKPYVSMRPLKGFFTPKTYAEINLESWFSGDYQSTTDNYLNENFGFRNFFVRVNNQFRFSAFKKGSVYGVLLGKENYLYEYGYVMGYHGVEFLGEKAIADSIAEIKFLQDTLASMGKQLLIVLAPSKVRVYPEFLPDSINPAPGEKTNYQYFIDGFKKLGINYIDFTPIFIEKKKSGQQVYPTLGVHWSRLEAVRAADSINRYLSYKSGTNLPQVQITKIVEKDTLEDPDNDIVNSLNLLKYPKFTKMSYPEIRIDSNGIKRNIIVVADSYWWDIYLRDIPAKVFANNEFWYYNKELWGNSYLGKTNCNSIDTKRHILQSDYVVLVCTESNCSRLGFGFLGAASSALKRTISPTVSEINDIKEKIKVTKEWYDQIKEKAVQRKLSVDSILTLDAHWYFQRKGPIKKDISIEDVKASITTNPQWLSEVTKGAKDKNISLDSAITENALWFMENILHVAGRPEKKRTSLKDIKDQILHDYKWMEEIRTKAQKRGVSVDSMITLDATWVLKQQNK